MKKIKLYIIVLACLLGTSCVDMEQKPLSYPHTENIVYDKNTMEIFANGLPITLWGSVWDYNCRTQILNLGADDIITGTLSKRHTQVDELNVYSEMHDADLASSYPNMYKVIYAANDMIAHIPLSTEESDEVKNPYVGEAYFYRAFAYYHLVRFFGDVPALTDPSMLEDIYGNKGKGNVVRGKTEDIYDQIIVPDLLKAIELLGGLEDGRARDKTNSKPSKVAAQTCLAEVYLTMAGWPLKRADHYTKARDLANTIITQNIYHGLAASYEDLWKEATKSNDKEHLFALNHSITNQSQYGVSYYAAEEGTSWGDYLADSYFYDKYPTGDRKAFNYVTTFVSNLTGEVTDYKVSIMKSPAIGKYRNYSADRKDSRTLGITPIFRWADVLLTYAEAQNMADGSPNDLAYKCLNDIRQRAAGEGNPYIKAENMVQATFAKAVFDEKGWEFFAEFKRWFHLVRTEMVKEANMFNPRIATSPYINNGEKLYLMPLPKSEIELSKLPQNPK